MEIEHSVLTKKRIKSLKDAKGKVKRIKYIMVRAPKGRGLKRLYEGSKYLDNGKTKKLKL